jgi:hypothetical protein
MPGARKLIARRDAEAKGRYGVCCWQERKGSRSLRRIPFMQKAAPPFASRGGRGEAEWSPAPPSPTLTLNDRWARVHQSLTWVLEDRGKDGIRTARAARRARMRQESEPSDARGARGGRALREPRDGQKGHPCPRLAGTSCPPGAMLGFGPTCGFIPPPRWARGPLSVHTDRGTSC